VVSAVEEVTGYTEILRLQASPGMSNAVGLEKIRTLLRYVCILQGSPASRRLIQRTKMRDPSG
jgi:hypothetical protein